ncbi:sugar O-acyltransferase (sialic acid O-acetyltransferase NeuD family) [Chryseobacterium defluvii]|uniref:Sugar O-acyltransferase (Sialic acid O-acetyltransferase NeuD family) n=1 Tax=Chryseobacterium defluvii TaxID=160396 RepID=A0A840KAY6_9FLAO|nr:acetyltransferase [Chryseobacterium defluvii]MBB4806591.1 sugar O-acyltransferase (sialic acid O-acetyltransferase NeuD family) [Chryseobacterium defluvii]
MNKEKIILIGGGGHCRSCIDVIESAGKYEIFGILDLPETFGERTLGYQVIGNDDDIERFHKEGFSFLITLGQIKSADRRKKIFEFLEEIGAKIPVIISAKATVSQHSAIEKGSVIMHGTIINAQAKIGKNCIINSGAIIEHDAEIGNHTHISTQAVINGDAKVGNECFVGSSSCISSQVKISDKSIIGAGSLVLNNISEEGTYVGSPVKKLNK